MPGPQINMSMKAGSGASSWRADASDALRLADSCLDHARAERGQKRRKVIGCRLLETKEYK